MPTEINAVIQQQAKAGPVREIQIIGGKEIRVITGLGSRQKVYHIALLALADKTHRRLHFSRPWGWGLLISVSAILIYALLRSVFNPGLAAYEFSIITVFGIAALLSLIMSGLHLSRKCVFYSRNAHIPLFEILVNNPDKRIYKKFLEDVHHHITQARGFWNLSMEQQIAGETKMLRRLASEGVISQSVYESAKDKLFALNNKRSK